jgi:Rap1a immunity proteins
MKYLMLPIFILLLSSVASAQKGAVSYRSGLNLVDSCKYVPDGVARSTDELVQTELGLGFCKGYIEAHAEALGLEGKVCLTTDNKPDQLIAVVKKYLADHPELWDKPALWLVRDALVQAFPCSK